MSYGKCPQKVAADDGEQAFFIKKRPSSLWVIQVYSKCCIALHAQACSFQGSQICLVVSKFQCLEPKGCQEAATHPCAWPQPRHDNASVSSPHVCSPHGGSHAKRQADS